MFGIDYAWGNPSVDALKKAGVKFVCRYVSTPGNSKNLRASEVTAFKAAGIKIVVVFETTASRALAGRAAGENDAKVAVSELAQVGAPDDAVVYFAVDFDASEAQQAAVNAYLSGAASVLGKDRVGVYGGFYVVKRALDAGVCKFAWQTYAWSGGHLDPRAHIYQYSNGHTLAGVSCDYDKALKDNFGQFVFSHPRFRFELRRGKKVLKASRFVRKSKLGGLFSRFHKRIRRVLRREAVAGHSPKIVRRRKSD